MTVPLWLCVVLLIAGCAQTVLLALAWRRIDRMEKAREETALRWMGYVEELKKFKPTKEQISQAGARALQRMYQSPEYKAWQEQMAQAYRPKSDFFQGDR